MMVNQSDVLQALDKILSDSISNQPDNSDGSQLLTRSQSINDTDKTGRQRLFPPLNATFSLFSENKLLLDQDY